MRHATLAPRTQDSPAAHSRMAKHAPARAASAITCLVAVLITGAATAQVTETHQPSDVQAVSQQAPTKRDAPPALAAPTKVGLTRREVVKRAVANGPSLRTRAAEREVAQSRVDQAVAAFLPRLKLSATYRRVSPVEIPLGNAAIVGAYNEGPVFVGTTPIDGIIVDSTGTPIGAQRFTIKSIENQYELKAELGIPLSDLLFRMPKTVGAAKRATEATLSLQQAERQKLALDATVAYYGFVRARSSVEVSRRSLDRARALLEDAKATTRAGVTTQTDQLRVDALVASTEVIVAEAERLEALTRRQLQLLLEDDKLSPEIGEDINATRTPLPVASEQELTRQAITNRLELRALRQAVDASEQKHSSQQVARFPRLDGFGQVVEGRPNSNISIPEDAWKATWAVGVTLSYSPNETISNGATAAEARADRERLKSELETAERGIRLQTASATYDLNKAKTAIGATKRGQEAATKAYFSAKALYRAGEATTTDLLDAETRLLSAELQYVYAQLDLATAEARVRYAIGEDLT